jgi:hypothetical protein
MAKEIDFSKVTAEQIKAFETEEMAAYIEYVTNLKTAADDKDALIKEQAEQIKDAEAVKMEVSPTVTHTIDKEKVTVRVNLKKFNHLGKSGQWELKTLKDLQEDANLIAELLEMRSNVVTQINKKPKK